jgi:co-chaperonin GroES (HSP10)
MKVTGTIKPLGAKVFVSDMEFGEQKSAGGIFIPSANGKAEGITPRWGRVWAIGPDQQDVKVGEWICVEHGRWTRTVEVEQEDGSLIELPNAEQYKKYKEKYIKLKISKQLNERKEYEKPAVTKRKVKDKAIYNEKRRRDLD